VTCGRKRTVREPISFSLLLRILVTVPYGRRRTVRDSLLFFSLLFPLLVTSDLWQEKNS
jgi:hypothetical protein